MLITAAILGAWTVACWFSQPFARPFLDLFIFDVDAGTALLVTALWTAGALAVHLLRHGRESAERFSAWLRGNLLPLGILALILALHLALEIPSLLNYRGSNDSDSAIAGLAGYHIAEGKARPMYRYRRHYIGSLTSHMAAALNAAFGKQPWHLRAVHALFYLGFLIVIYALANRLFDRWTALLSAALAALAPYEIMRFIRYPEMVEILFWGSLSLLVLARLLEADSPSRRGLFAYGLVLGILFYAHPQGVYFIVTGILMLLTRNKLMFAKPRALLLPIGFAVGSVVTFIDSFYYDWIIFRHFITSGIDASGEIASIFDRLLEFLSLAPVLLGARTDALRSDILGPPFTLIASAILLAAVSFAVLRITPRAKELCRVTSRVPGELLVLSHLLVVFLVFVLSSYSIPPSSARYLLPMWIIIPPLIALPATRAAKLPMRITGAIGLAAVAVILLASNITHQVQLARFEASWLRWEKFCRERGIEKFFGDYWITLQTAHFAREEIIGSSCYPNYLAFDPYYPYREAIERSAAPAAYVFSPRYDRLAKGKAEHFAQVLRHLNISFRREEFAGDTVFLDLSYPLKPVQLTDLRLLNGAEIKSCEASALEAPPPAPGAILFTLRLRNTGETIWQADGGHGYWELVVVDGIGRELRRQPLVSDVRPGGDLSWRFLLEEGEARGDGLDVSVRLNDIPLARVTASRVECLRSDSSPRQRDLEATKVFSNAGLGAIPDYLWLGGWGGFEGRGHTGLRWTGGPASKLGFVLRKPRDLVLVLRAQPFRDDMEFAGPQQLKLLCNGREVASAVELERTRGVLVTIPAYAVNAGLNTLTFTCENVQPRFRYIHKYPEFHFRPKGLALEHLRFRRAGGEDR